MPSGAVLLSLHFAGVIYPRWFQLGNILRGDLGG